MKTHFSTLHVTALFLCFAPLAAAGTDVAVIVPNAVGSAPEWRFTSSVPGQGWQAADFDDSLWQKGVGGFGTAATPNSHVRTNWDTKSIWLRRTFEMPSRSAGEVFLLVHYDEDAEVFLNGVKAARLPGWNSEAQLIPIAADALATLRSGKNTIAVHCGQTTGGQYIDVGLIQVAGPRWPAAKAWQWYRGQPWPCGFNYVPANSISYTEMWMDYAFDTAVIDRELSAAQDVGFNCLRVVLPFVVWEHDPQAFKKRVDTFLSICARRGQRVMFAMFDDCVFGPIADPAYGKQPGVVAGWYANGWTPSPGHSLVRDVAQWSRLERYVKDVVGSFREDDRVWVWDLYNEPTNGGLGDLSEALVDRVFDWAREVKPKQPLTVGLWNDDARLNRLVLLNSDIITFHNYNTADHLSGQITRLQDSGRPIICTEWLNRGQNSSVATCLPVFEKSGTGCMHWGLVNGKTQTNLNWGHRPGQPDPKVWQHDLFHGDYRPYATDEIEQFRRAIRARATSGSVD